MFGNNSLRLRRIQQLMPGPAHYIPEFIKEPLRSVAGKPHPYGLSRSERMRLQKLPRYTQTDVTLFDRQVCIPDAASFLASHREIFEQQIYQFSPQSSPPVIIDAGANTGLASIFWGLKFPDAQITAFESDPDICRLLKENLSTFEVSADIRQAAVWSSDGEITFSSEGADAGRVEDGGAVTVPSVRLKTILDSQQTDLLKIDIEGAEVEVLNDCGGSLSNVSQLFVEYHSAVGSKQQLSRLLHVLESAGFRYYIEHTGVHSGLPLVNRNSEAGFDLQLNIFASQEAS